MKKINVYIVKSSIVFYDLRSGIQPLAIFSKLDDAIEYINSFPICDDYHEDKRYYKNGHYIRSFYCEERKEVLGLTVRQTPYEIHMDL